MKWTMMVVVAMAACDCPDGEPETYNGGRKIGWYRDDGRECATYRTLWCDYTLCEQAGMCGWDLAEWVCW